MKVARTKHLDEEGVQMDAEKNICKLLLTRDLTDALIA
jgi:hypothetical protein